MHRAGRNTALTTILSRVQIQQRPEQCGKYFKVNNKN